VSHRRRRTVLRFRPPVACDTHCPRARLGPRDRGRALRPRNRRRVSPRALRQLEHETHRQWEQIVKLSDRCFAFNPRCLDQDEKRTPEAPRCRERLRFSSRAPHQPRIPRHIGRRSRCRSANFYAEIFPSRWDLAASACRGRVWRVRPRRTSAELASAPQPRSAIRASIGMLKACPRRSSVATLPCLLCVSICAIRLRATAERDASSVWVMPRYSRQAFRG